jgi:YVTN family beta-propeller protein
VSVIDVERGVVESRSIVVGSNMLQGIATVPGADVALFTLMRTKNLIPTSRLAQGWVITNGLGVVWPDGRVDQLLLDEPSDSLPDLMDVAVSPDGRRALVVSAGADQVAVVDIDKMLGLIRTASDRERAELLPNHMGKSAGFVVTRIPVGRNPRAVAYSPDGTLAYVANALDDTVTVLDTSANRAVRTIGLGGPSETTQIRWGERLFHDASNTFGRQFSCRSCHPDGHHNGLTFDIEADEVGLNPVDNRSLRGILDTPPFKWEGTNPSLHRQCGPRLAVFFTRLDPFTPDELDALVNYMSTIEQPPNRFRDPGGLTLAQRRGKAVFERTARNRGNPIPPLGRCSHCHSGAYRTNREKYQVSTMMWFDEHVNVDLEDLFQSSGRGELGVYYFVNADVSRKMLDVPHLRNIADGAPYLHNGAARTLEEIWTVFNIAERHGATGDLTRQQMNDLIAYLKAQ